MLSVDVICYNIFCKCTQQLYFTTDRLMLLEVLSCMKTYSLMSNSLNWMTLWMSSELLARMVNSQVDPVIRDAFIVKLVVSFWARSFEIVKGIFYSYDWSRFEHYFYSQFKYCYLLLIILGLHCNLIANT